MASTAARGYYFDGLQLHYPETEWDEVSFQSWIHNNFHWSLISSALYLLVIYGGQKMMENRPAFNLRGPLVAWSAALSLFSIVGFVRMFHGTLWMIERKGLHNYVCANPTVDEYMGQMWGGLFALSKLLELGDTAFIVLRKQPLIFLHWYHHITVLVFVWHSYAEYTAPGKVFMVINYGVHAVMYTYYTFRALRYRMPVALKKFVTSLQLSQMVIGCSLTVYSYWLKREGVPCRQSDDNLFYGSLMYLSYLVLFAKFYYDAYIAPRVASVLDNRKKSASNGGAAKSWVNGTNGTAAMHAKSANGSAAYPRKSMRLANGKGDASDIGEMKLNGSNGRLSSS